MGSIPLLATQIQSPRDPLEEFGRIAALKSQLQQQQSQQIQLQEQQQGLTDQKALTQAYSQAKNIEEVPGLFVKLGGSGKSAMALQNGVLEQKQKALSFNDAQIANEVKQADLQQGAHDAVKSAPPEARPQEYQRQLSNLQRSGVDVSQLPPQYPGDQQFELLGHMTHLHSQMVTDAKDQAEIAQNNAKAANENAQAGLNNIKLGLAKNATPGSFDSQIDQIYPPVKGQPSAQNAMLKNVINGSLARGDVDSAKQFVDQALQNVQSLNKDIAVATNPQIQRGKVQVAAAEGQARANVEAAAARGSNAALAQVPVHLIAPAAAAGAKAGEDFATANQAAQNLSDFLREAKSGNKAAVKIVPLQGALEITTAQGVHRINRTEVDQYGGAGSLYDKLAGKVGGILTGKDIDNSVLDDMDALQRKIAGNAKSLYKSKLNVVNQTYGSKFAPAEMDQAAPGTESNTGWGAQFGGSPHQ